jgi:hypothetical protein
LHIILQGMCCMSSICIYVLYLLLSFIEFSVIAHSSMLYQTFTVQSLFGSVSLIRTSR